MSFCVSLRIAQAKRTHFFGGVGEEKSGREGGMREGGWERGEGGVMGDEVGRVGRGEMSKSWIPNPRL